MSSDHVAREDGGNGNRGVGGDQAEVETSSLLDAGAHPRELESKDVRHGLRCSSGSGFGQLPRGRG